MKAIGTLLVVLLMALNWGGGIISGIWLAVLGEWWAIGWGIAALFFSHFVLGLILGVGLLFAAPAARLMESGRTFFAYPLIAVSTIYTYGVIILWCLFVMNFFFIRSTSSTEWPLVVWSYGVALAPLMFMAQKDVQSGDGEAASLTTIFAQIAYVVTGLLLLLGNFQPTTLFLTFSGIMGLGICLQLYLAVERIRFRRRMGF